MKHFNWQLLYISITFLAFYLFAVIAILRIPLNKKEKRLPEIVSKYVVSFTFPSSQQIKNIPLVSRISSILVGGRNETWIKENLLRIGRVQEGEFSKTVRHKVIFGVSALFISILYYGSIKNAPLILGITAFGYYLPEILIYNQTQKIGAQIQQSLPEAVDMLSMCVDTGLTFQQALDRVSANQNTIIGREFSRILSEISIGTPRTEALNNMAQRLRTEDVTRFVTALSQVDRLGIPVSSVLKEQVAEMRAKNRERAREQAQKVPVKILGPIMLCFLPCVLIIVLGPTILSLVNALSGF